MRPETKNRTPTGIKTKAAGITMFKIERRNTKKVTEEDDKLLEKTETEDV